MKKLLIITALLISGIVSKAQEALPMENGKVTYTEVVELKDKSRDVLFENGKKWFSQYYKLPKTLKTEDKENGKLVGESHFKLKKDKTLKEEKGAVYYTITIGVKDGRYKYTITEFSHRDYSAKDASGGRIEEAKPASTAKSVSEKDWEAIKGQIPAQVKEIIESLKKTMATGDAPVAGDDW